MRGVGLLILVVVIIGIVLLGFRIHRTTEDRAWRRAKAEARWVPATRNVATEDLKATRTEFYVHRTAQLGERAEKLDEQHGEWLDYDASPRYPVLFAEAWGRTEYLASVRNATG